MREADPYEESGPVSMCANCYEGVHWTSSAGWVHDGTKKKACEK